MVQPLAAGKRLATCKCDNQLHTCRTDEGIVCEVPKDGLKDLWGIQYLCGQSVKKHLQLWAVSHVDIELTTKEIMEEEEKHVS